MAAAKKIFKFKCAHCDKPFTVLYALTGSDPDKQDDTGEVVVTCMYCGGDVMITIPREYISEVPMLRSAAR